MELPERLDEWKIETIKQILSSEDYERPEFEFKEALVQRGPDDSAEDRRNRIRHCALAFANTLTGHLIFGVKDRENESELLKRLVGIEPGDHRVLFGELIKEAEPGVAFDTTPKLLPVPLHPGRGVLVVRIPHSPLRPHCLRGVFHKRVHAGSVATMTRQEVLEAMLGTTDRLKRVALLRMELVAIRRVAGALANITLGGVVDDATYAMTRYDVASLKPLLIDLGSLLPVGNRAVELLVDLQTIAGQQDRLLDHLLSINSLVIGGPRVGIRELWVSGVRSGSGDIQRMCEEVEKLLTARFGPM